MGKLVELERFRVFVGLGSLELVSEEVTLGVAQLVRLEHFGHHFEFKIYSFTVINSYLEPP